MDILKWSPYILPVLCGILFLIWLREIGFLRSLTASLSRYLWASFFVLCLTPRDRRIDLPSTLISKKINVLVDDSNSVSLNSKSRSESELALSTIKSACLASGCLVKETKLSEISPKTKEGFSPIGEGMASFLFYSGRDPWILVSDGGETRPEDPLPKGTSKGLIIGVGLEEGANYAIKSISSSSLAFEGKPTEVVVHVERSGIVKGETVQIQASLDSNPVASINLTFDANKTNSVERLTIPPLKKGQYLLSIGVVGVGSEKILWDNTDHVSIEVLPNTVGVLHVLGSPDWDGRFLRRYLKSEPKYDLVSFYILRDPFDHSDVGQRELSLIPFPVEQLFSTELSNFRVLALQNFTFQKFLQPELAKNLIDFVKNGGGALILGGPRAFKDIDLSSSALSDILPFNYRGPTVNSPMPMLDFPEDVENGESKNSNVPWYDSALKFRIQLANPSSDERALASIFDEFESLAPDLEEVGELRGLHHIENVEFKKGEYTTLLEAVRSDGKIVPLVIATYPGKGRAVWVFTDRLWEIAMAGKMGRPARDIYNQLQESIFSWLLREDIRKPIRISDVKMSSTDKGTDFKIHLVGPALRYVSNLSDWSVGVCDRVISSESLKINRFGTDELHLVGSVRGYTAGGLKCMIKLEARNRAFGSIKLSQVAHVPEVFTDRELPSSRGFLSKLATQLNSSLITDLSEVSKWIEKETNAEGVILAPRSKMLSDYYWIFEMRWAYLLLLGLLGEVLARRWDKIFGDGRIFPIRS